MSKMSLWNHGLSCPQIVGALFAIAALGLAGCGAESESAMNAGLTTSINRTELAPLDMFNSDITHEDYGRQLDVTLPYLQERRAQSMQEVKEQLDIKNRINLTDPNQYPEGSMMRKAQEDQNNITADLWTISKETNTTLARNLLNSVLQNDPGAEHDAYDLVAKQIGNGKGYFLEPTYVFEASPLYNQGILAGVEVTGQSTYLVKLGSDSNGKIYEEVISERHSQDGKSSSPVVVRSIQYGGTNWVENPSQLKPEK